jgi:chorismate mutase
LEQKSLNNIGDSKDLLSPEEILYLSRGEINQIDNDLIYLIVKRTSLAREIVESKLALNMDIFDPEREKSIFKKIEKIANEKNFNDSTKESLIEIMRILMNLSKKEQKEIINDNE